ncbi:putative sugar transporter-3 [Coleophoma crateriformis]|uniref:Putative sugar transporter-3 n=1 Tax=Coleophoma crateriformis TaxID=565419 RepID=A0A3D8QL38_9HELO|nr:putative sugar transporter-3 [Coleophoma crateriformis]
MVGRIINGVSMGIEANNIPMYMAELSPPSIRGSMINMYQWWLFIGAIIAKVVIFKSNDAWLNSQWAWRTVLIVQFAVPILLLGVVVYLPESPRFLVRKGRFEEARKSLAFIRRGAATEEEIEEEFQLTCLAVEEQQENHKANTYLDCFKGTNGRRLMIAVVCQLIEQLSGNAFMTNYAVIFMAQVGINNPLRSNIATICMGIAGSTLAFFVSDKFGRRPLMIGTALGMWVGLWVISGIVGYLPGGVPPGGPLSQFCLFLLLIWSLFSNLGWGSCVWIVTAETPTLQLREKSMSITTFISFLSVVIVTYISPFIQNDPGYLGVRIGFIWGAFSLLGAVFVYFCVPELSGRSLEELDELFNEKVSARKFHDYVCSGTGARITEIEDKNANMYAHIIQGQDKELSRDAKTPRAKIEEPAGKSMV